MADVKIVDLNSIVTQNTTDIYEVSANGTGSFKESRSQQLVYWQENITSLPGLTTVGTITIGTWNGTPISLTSFVSGILPISHGGTGINTVPSAGSLLVGTGGGAYQKLFITSLVQPGSTNSIAEIFVGGTLSLDVNSSVVPYLSTDNTFTGTNTFSKINLTNYIPNHLYIGSSGSDSNNGQIIQPLLTITFADANASNGTSLFIPAGSHNETSLQKKSGVNWFGDSMESTFFGNAISGTIGINNTQWAATTGPNFSITNMTIVANTFNFSPTTYVSKSTQTFKNVIFNPNFQSGNLTNLTLQNCTINNPVINDCVNLTIDNCKINGNIQLFGNDGTDVPIYNVIIKDSICSGSISFVTTGGTTNFNLTLINCPGITGVSFDDSGSFTLNVSVSYDLTSYPTTGFNQISLSTFTEKKLDGFSVSNDGTALSESLNINYFDINNNLQKVKLCPTIAINTSTFQLINNAQYILNHSGVTTLTLPTASDSSLDFMRIVMSANSGGFIIAQNVSNKIYYGSRSTTTGVGGSVSSISASGNTIIDLYAIDGFLWAMNASQPVIIA